MLVPIHEEMTREALNGLVSPRALEVIIAANRKDLKTIDQKATENDAQIKELLDATEELQTLTSVQEIKDLAKDARVQMQEWDNRATKIEDLAR